MPRSSIRGPLLSVAALLLALTTACQDSAALLTAPDTAPARGTLVTPLLSLGDTTVQQFTVIPGQSGTYVLANSHKVSLAANSVCDPLLSSYGTTEWDKPCTVLVRPLVFTAKSWTDASGHPHVRFSPDVRFARSATNTLTLMDKSSASILATARIGWCPTNARSCVDEAATDPSLATVLGTNGMLSRRVKHFSGYTVVAD